ncbi:penicillin-binding protein activator [Shewanella surugensis]|uniref:Penicillin-binding protein activator n=1 Tax=Shewanella surugensis TaxID=212020 RepID=A0ABT0LE20_9GAMM|nr:penicillin-binding protein activator [Shewanella surugensis]MCL1125575.1 penicillin-binding protein activator [Shewanella surugensis]
MLKSLNTTKLISIAMFSAVLFGCATTTGPVQTESTSISLISAPLTSAQYLTKAKAEKNQQPRERYLLLAAHAMINAGDVNTADQLLNSMQATLLPISELQAEFKYLKARILKVQNRNDEAIKSLDYPNNWRLANWQWVSYYQLKAQLYQERNQPIEEVRQLSHLSQYLPMTQANEVNDNIWRTLQPLAEETLKRFTADKDDPIFAGWLQLAYLTKRYAVDPNQLVSQLSRWQQQNPSHPATRKLPTDLENALNTKPYRPNNIAVLLPLSGPRAVIADPVKQGIMASYLAQNANDVKVNFFDTAQDPKAAYQTAVASGAEFIIGPLLPESVAALHTTDTSTHQPLTNNGQVIPQLFLNSVKGATPNKDQFYFALSPSDEANDAANRLFKDGIKIPLILASNDKLGHNMADSFSKTWSELTQSPAEVHFYDAGDKMKVTVQKALGVIDSKERISALKRLLNIPIKADFRSRRDIDAIYMLSASHDLALLKPFIDVNFSVFTQPVPLYASSRSHLKDGGREADEELNNLTISDIPWLIRPDSDTRMVSQLWPTWSNSKKRLYSMGYDAIDLVGKLAQMRALPGYQLNGLSGVLSVTEQGRVNRQLSWGRYQRGNLKPLSQ